MTKTKVIKGFDCVTMKRKGQDRIYKATRGMTAEQRLKYIHDQATTGEMGAIWRNMEKRDPKAA
jgi:hypothetical protein